MWHTTQKAFNSANRKQTKIVLNGIENPAGNAEVLNTFVVKIGPTLDEALGVDSDIVTEPVLECHQLSLQLTNEKEISTIIQNLSIHTASVEDVFSTRTSKQHYSFSFQ